MAAGILGWMALALQYALVLTGLLGADSFTRSINFFSYFTILTNILAALALTLPWLAPQSAPGKFFARPTVRTAIAASIIIVMTVVYFVLRHLTTFQGWNFVADLLLHYVMPVLFVIDWLLLVPKQTLKVSDTLGWLAFPIIYLAWTFIHGAFSSFYPYPFLNGAELGNARVLLNEAGLLVIFLVLGFILVSGGRLLDKHL
ncbi:MAG: Pr6Pr family membrane protein [Aestuariivirga sp.]